MEFTSGVPWWLYRKKKTHGKLYPGRKVAVAMQFMLGALQKKKSKGVSKYCVSFDIISCCHVDHSVQKSKGLDIYLRDFDVVHRINDVDFPKSHNPN